jgi:arylsulfatase
MPDELKPVLERQMETYAAFLTHTDHHVGRLVDVLEELAILDDTLVFCIVGDNGASAEGSLNGAFNELIHLNGMGEVIETPEFLTARIDQWGSPEAYNHYAVGWAWAMDTPFQWTKQVASHWGGTRNGTIVHWPKGVQERGGLRSQFCHVIDVAPTVLEVAGIPEPTTVNGVTQSPYEGTSMAYTFDAADEPERHDLQYFEMFGNRGIYHRGWSAVTKHRTPWKLAIGTKTLPFDQDVWELYDGSSDYSQAHDLSKEMPDKLRELQELWLEEARKYNVLPLDDRAVERLSAELAGRPSIAKGTRQTFYPGMARISEASVLDVKNKSFQVTAQLVVPEGGASGTIVAQGGAYGGWGLLLHEGSARFVYNLFGVNVFVTDATETVSAGEHQVRAEFAYAGGGFAKGGEVNLYYDGQKVGAGRILVTQPMAFSATEGLEIGRELGTTVLPRSRPEGTVFTGELKWVELSVGDDDHGHLIEPEDRLQLLMSQQ